MIATLSGLVAEKLAQLVVVDVGGVGYGVSVVSEDNAQLKINEAVKFYIYEHIRESAHDLYGFLTNDTKQLFELLLGVNGVGPKMALNILSIGTTKEVKQAIAGGDVKFIQAANGVGKRVAERVVVDLKDKVGLISSTSNDSLFVSDLIASQDEAIQALVSLGYSVSDASLALSDISDSLSTEDRVKQALKGRVN